MKPTAPPCEQPLGICIIFGINAVDANYEFSSEERNQSIGTADLKIVNPYSLKITSDTKFSYDNGTIELEGNVFINENLANQLGYKKIKLHKGIYCVNSNEGRFGSVIVRIAGVKKIKK